MKSSLLALLILLSAGQTFAQLDSCNVFLQGYYVEVGINWNGAYGSSVPTPTTGYCGRGYHAQGASSVGNSIACGSGCPPYGVGLGFVADPDKDGWTVGSPYIYYGDYFLPGTPQEGWSIEADGIQADNFNGNGCTGNICGICSDTDAFGHTGGGSNTSYSTSEAIITAVWQGMWDSLLITQTTTLDTSQTFFTTKVTVKNMSSTTRHNVYYQRTVDPDNSEPETGNFATKNIIEYQLPDTAHKVLVSTWGLTPTGSVISSNYLGLGTMDSNAKCYIMKSGLYPPTGEKIDSLFNAYPYSTVGGGDTANTLMHQNDSLQQDVGIGLIYKIGDLAPVDTIVVSYAYAFRRGIDLDSALKTTFSYTDTSGNPNDTSHHHTAVNNLNNQNKNINIYPNPVRDGMTISGLNASDQVTVFDMMGREVENLIITSSSNNSFSTTNLTPGMYILRVIDVSGNIKAKIPLQKL